MSRRGKKNSRVQTLIKQFEGHQQNLDSENFSLPDDEGLLAILSAELDPQREAVVSRHARERAELEVARGTRGYDRIEVIDNATEDDLVYVLGEIGFSSVVLIGNGSLGAYKVTKRTESPGKWVPWTVTFEHARRALKQGYIEQRTCGTKRVDGQVSVPIGTFAVTDQVQVSLPIHRFLSTANGLEEMNRFLRPVYSHPVNSLEQILKATDQAEFLPELHRRLDA